MVQEFLPRGRSTPETREDVARLLRSGDLEHGLRRCRANGWNLEEFRGDLETGARRLALGHRPGLLLSFMHRYGIACQFEPIFLLRIMFELRDYPGVLKQAHRFGIIDGFDSEIERAIAYHDERGLVDQATAWRRKFTELRAARRGGSPRSQSTANGTR